MKMTETCQLANRGLATLEASKLVLGCNWVRQRKTVEWTDGLAEQWGSYVPGQGQSTCLWVQTYVLSLSSSPYIVPLFPHLQPIFKYRKCLQLESEVRLVTALLGNQEGGKNRVV